MDRCQPVAAAGTGGRVASKTKVVCAAEQTASAKSSKLIIESRGAM